MPRSMLACLALLLCPLIGVAADVCPTLRQQQFSGDSATRIAAVACNEHQLWYRPFIDTNGRIASGKVWEGESSRLDDGGTEAWRRVAMYWRESGLLWQMAGFAGATDCGNAAAGGGYMTASCRAFVIDNPWSAAFISYVLTKANLPGFRASASHFDYVRDAYQRPAENAYQFLDPATARPETGDLLCNVRIPSRAYGYQGLIAAIDSGANGLNMHCDIVTATNPGNDGTVYLVGGNVHQGVTMRMLPVNRSGALWALPQRVGPEPFCSPDTVASCNFNRLDWSVLLKLKSPAALAQLPRAAQSPVGMMSPPVPSTNCCVNCLVGANPPVPRCAARPNR
ncbi:MAG: DUF2272 domain-containing protein [Pseudomonadota bacterium]|nr:DUF2272 domain-containing protein [Pseudomonadota bacterium]